MRRVFFVFALLALTASAGNVYLTQKWGEWTSSEWSNTNIWDVQRVPASGETVYVGIGANAGSHTIILTNDLTESHAELFPTLFSGSSVTLDGNGYDIAPPTVESATYTSDTVLDFKFRLGYSYCTALRYGASTTTLAPYKLTNPKITWSWADGVRTIDFERGDCNFYDASGSGSSYRTLSFNMERDLYASSVIRLRSGTSLRVGKVQMYGAALTNRWILEGATVGVSNGFYATQGRWGDAAKLDTVELTDGARLTVNGEFKITANSTYPTYLPQRLFSIRDGATFVQTGTSSHQGSLTAPKLTVEVVNATWNLSAVTANYTFSDVSSPCESRLVLSNAVWKLGANVMIGNGAAQERYPVRMNDSQLRALVSGGWLQWYRVAAGVTNCLIATEPGSAYYQHLMMPVSRGASVTMTDCAVSNAVVRIGSAPADEETKLVIDGGAWRPSSVSIGYDGDTTLGTNVLRLVDGTVTLWVDDSHGSASACVDIGRTSHGALLLEGGRLVTPHLNGGESGKKGTGATARLTGNGGTVACLCTDSSANWIYNLDVAEAGAEGLWLDTNGSSPTVVQDFTDIAGEEGVLTKTGAGTLKLTATKTDVSTVRVEEGSLKLTASGENAFSTTLELTNGAGFSISDGKATTLRLTGLNVADGVIELDTNDVVIVDGDADVTRLTVKFATTPLKGIPLPWLQVTGALSESSRRAIALAACGNTVADGQHPVFDMTYDGTAETWKIVTKVEDDATPLTATTTWQGGPWGSADGWSAGVPTAATTAAFPAGAGTITVPSGAVAGALSFAGDAELTGADLTIASAEGAADITVADGAVRIDSTLVFTLSRRTTAQVASGASLILAGGVDGTDLVKSGDGALTLSGDGRAVDAPAFANGLNTLAAGDALAAAQTLKLGGGTLAVTADVALPPGAIATTDATKPQIVKTDVNTVASPYDVTAGGFLKRGAGKLTVDFSGSTKGHVLTTLLTTGTWGDFQGLPADISHAYSFPADGSAPAGGFSGFTVAEGELVLKSDSTKYVQEVKGSFLVGMYTPDGTVSPSLTLDSVALKHYGYKHSFIGLNVGANDNFARSVTFRILNGSTFSCDTLIVGIGSSSANPHEIVLAMTNGTITASSYCHWSQDSNADTPVKIRAKDSAFYGSHSISGAIDADFDNSDVGANSASCGSFSVGSSTKGQIVVRNGSRWRIKTFNGMKNLTSELALIFDGGYYEWGTGDFTLSMPSGTDPALFRFETRGEGLFLKPSAGKTLTINYPITGTGGLTLESAGTVAFGAGTYQFTGPVYARAGTVDLSNAGTVTNGYFGACAGTIAGGTFRDAVFTLGDEALALQNCAFENRAVVDVGDEPLANPLPKDKTLFTFTGTAPDVSGWRLKGKGRKGLGATFAVDGNTVKVTIQRRGILLLLR